MVEDVHKPCRRLTIDVAGRALAFFANDFAITGPKKVVVRGEANLGARAIGDDRLYHVASARLQHFERKTEATIDAQPLPSIVSPVATAMHNVIMSCGGEWWAAIRKELRSHSL